jgi:hypothetical protein
METSKTNMDQQEGVCQYKLEIKQVKPRKWNCQKRTKGTQDQWTKNEANSQTSTETNRRPAKRADSLNDRTPIGVTNKWTVSEWTDDPKRPRKLYSNLFNELKPPGKRHCSQKKEGKKTENKPLVK